MTHRLALVSTYRFGNEPRAIPDCHLWEMAHRILQRTIPGEISRFRMLPRISTVSTTCQTAESGVPIRMGEPAVFLYTPGDTDPAEWEQPGCVARRYTRIFPEKYESFRCHLDRIHERGKARDYYWR